jgi:SAM-dependent methyltransferase
MTTIAPKTWHSDEDLEVDGTRFHLAVNSDDYTTAESTSDEFVLVKNRVLVDQMTRTLERLKPQRIVEVGIFKGGSAALLAALSPTAQITAVDISPQRVAALDQFITARGLEGRLHPYYGVDQGNAERLAEIVDRDHGTKPLDYVVDDASHLYRETRTTFEVLFPRLRPGGVYAIEDWAWAHFPDDLWQAGGGWFHNRPALTNLVVELLMIVGTTPELISNLHISHDCVEVVRGHTHYQPRIRLEDHYQNRGLPFRPLM